MQFFNVNNLFILLLIGLFIAVVKTYLIFRKLTVKNINRISKFNKEYVSILKFHLPKDQILIIVMIVGGSLIRKSNLVSKEYLLPIYFGIGFAMLYSSVLYFKFYFQNRKNNKLN